MDETKSERVIGNCKAQDIFNRSPPMQESDAVPAIGFDAQAKASRGSRFWNGVANHLLFSCRTQREQKGNCFLSLECVVGDGAYSRPGRRAAEPVGGRPARKSSLAANGGSRYGAGMADNPFTKHPRELGESYPQHFGMALRFGLKMIAGGLGCIVHAVFPFLCERTGSETVRGLNASLTKRVDKPNWERHPII